MEVISMPMEYHITTTTDFSQAEPSQASPTQTMEIMSTPTEYNITTMTDITQAEPSQPDPTQNMKIMSLPTEIHLNIHDFLDHPSLLNLAATNKYFRGLVSKQKIIASLLCFEKCSLVSSTLLTRNALRPCYTCLKGLSAWHHFIQVQEVEDTSLAGRDASTRICATCLTKTRPEVINRYGSPRNPDSVFDDYGPRYGKSVLYYSRYDNSSSYRSYRWWLACPQCEQVKRYEGSPHGRRRRYDEAMLEGNVCAACYQPVWDKENERRREKKNARGRERYREKKEQARKLKESAIKYHQEQQEQQQGTNNMTLAQTTALPEFRYSNLFMPMNASVQPTNMGFMDGFDDWSSDALNQLFSDDGKLLFS
jgi:hypothetical protein